MNISQQQFEFRVNNQSGITQNLLKVENHPKNDKKQNIILYSAKLLKFQKSEVMKIYFQDRGAHSTFIG